MKHILNNLTEQEKNAIREQHTGGMKVSTDRFNQLLESKLGDSKPLVSEQGIQPQPGNVTTGQTDGGKAELIQIMIDKLNNMAKNPKFNASGVAQVVYNNAAHFLNKTDIFNDQTKYGQPFPTKVPFAPQGLSEQTKSFDPKTFNPGTALIKPKKPEPVVSKKPYSQPTPKGQTISLIQIKIGNYLVDLNMMRKTSQGATFFGKIRDNKEFYEVLFNCGDNRVVLGLYDGPSNVAYESDTVSPEALKLLNKAAGCDAYAKNQDTSTDDVTLAEQTYTTKGTNTGGQQYDITSPFKVGQTIKGKRSIDGQIYTITVAQVGQGFIGGKIMGPGTYNNKPLDGKFPWELNTNTPGVLHGNNEMGTFTIVK